MVRTPRRWMSALAVVGTLAASALVFGTPTSAAPAGPCGNPGERPWCNTKLSPEERAGLLLGALTQDEKINLLSGASNANGHTGATQPVERVGLRSVYVTDGPVGVRQGSATALPIPMALAATFSREMAFRYGDVIGNEAKGKGNDGLLAPNVNIMRTPLNGRTFEAYGEDPFLVSRIGVGWIEGAQSQGVFATVKHYAANNQEGADPTGLTTREGGGLGAGAQGDRFVENSVVDERTLREVYLPQFEAAIREAGAGSVMCSYNRFNGQYACANEHLLSEVLRNDWGFKGFVMSDWFLAAHTTDVINQLNNGLDLEMPFAISYNPTAVQVSMAAGQVSTDTLDARVRAILRTLFAFGFFDRAAYANDDKQIDQKAHARTALQVEESAITLLVNRGALPLDAHKLSSISLIGADADGFKTGGGSANVTPFAYTTPRQAITKRAGPRVKVAYDDGSDAARAAGVAKESDVAVVFVSAYQTEGGDRSCLSLNCPGDDADQDALIDAVAAAQPNTLVVLETGGPVLTPWRDKVKGLLEAWFPGQEGGTAIASVLFGDVDPGGRLPATFPKNEGDLPTAGDSEKYPGDATQNVYYKEGVFVGYRHYDAKNIAPAFPFGYGLSYTTFRYDDLRIEPGVGNAVATVSARVTNTGRRAGVAVPQLYLGLPSSAAVPQPPKQLKGFDKLALKPGKSARVSFSLDDRAFSYWNAAADGWRVAPGCYAVMVGASSRDLPLRGVISRGGASCGAGSVVLGKRVAGAKPALTRTGPLPATGVTGTPGLIGIVLLGGGFAMALVLIGRSRRRA